MATNKPLETPSELDKLYQPSISDLELNEHQGEDRPVIYLDQAKAAITSLIVEEVEKATNDAYDLLFWKYKEMNHQSVDRVFAEAYGILKEELATLTNTESKDGGGK